MTWTQPAKSARSKLKAVGTIDELLEMKDNKKDDKKDCKKKKKFGSQEK